MKQKPVESSQTAAVPREKQRGARPGKIHLDTLVTKLDRRTEQLSGCFR